MTMDAFSYKYMQMAVQASMGQIPIGSNIVAYVRSTGVQANDTTAITSKFYSSVLSALSACTSGRRDVIMVLNGHVERVNTAMFTSAPTDVRIIGVGGADEDLAPTFKWSGAADNLAIAAKNTTIANMRFLADANDVTEMITVTAAGVKFLGCWVDAGVTSSTDALIVFNVSTGANQCSIIGCDLRCTAASGVTQFIKLATVVDETKIIGNKIMGFGSSTTVGLIDISAATTNVFISGNYIDQQKTSGTVAVSVANVASTGFICDNYFSNLNNGVANATGIIYAGTNSLIRSYQNFNCDEPNKSGVLSPAVVAT